MFINSVKDSSLKPNQLRFTVFEIGNHRDIPVLNLANHTYEDTYPGLILHFTSGACPYGKEMFNLSSGLHISLNQVISSFMIIKVMLVKEKGYYDRVDLIVEPYGMNAGSFISALRSKSKSYKMVFFVSNVPDKFPIMINQLKCAGYKQCDKHSNGSSVHLGEKGES